MPGADVDVHTETGSRRWSRRVFISYRRRGGQAHALNFHQGLADVLGRRAVFLDVAEHAMQAGHPWKQSVRKALAGCDTLLLVLDPDLTARLSNQDDAIRFELETAIAEQLRVVPVRVENACIPEASALPGSLAWLGDIQSPAVHPDSAVADVKRVIRELTGREPGAARYVNRWDLAVLGAIVGLGLLAWVSWGRHFLNLSETWLWGVGLLIPWLGWLVVRRVLPGFGRGWVRQNLARAGTWFVALLAVATAWSFWRYAVYRTPRFSGDSGILVARLERDPMDVYQRELVVMLADEMEVVDGSRTVSALPRRVDGLSSRRYGTASGAAVVLWGRVLYLERDKPRLDVELRFIDRQAILQPIGKVVGRIEKEASSLGGDLEFLRLALPRLLEGYRLYHVAADDKSDLARAAEYFTDALDTLEGAHGTTGNSPALDDILATLHFYLANIHLCLNERKLAERAYEEAIEHSLHRVERARPQHIEAVNNLGWLLRDKGEPLRAVEELERVDFECVEAIELRSCAYAWYNLGVALLDTGDLEAAEARLVQARKRIDATGDVDDCLLAASASQNLAYALVRRAASSTGAVRTRLLGRAEHALSRAETTLREARLEIPPRYGITRSRIHLESQEWQRGIELLSSIESKVTGEDLLPVHYLLAAALGCVGDKERAQGHLNMALRPADEGQDINRKREAIAEFNRLGGLCKGVMPKTDSP